MNDRAGQPTSNTSPSISSSTRERVMPSLPYVIVYPVRDDVVFVVRILHGAQQWP